MTVPERREIEAWAVVDKHGILSNVYRRQADAKVAMDFGNEHAPTHAPWTIVRCVGAWEAR